MSSKSYHADHLWLDGRWADRARVDVDTHGRIARLASEAPLAEADSLGKWVLPGMPNLHSHAFQRAMAGLAERRGNKDDNFWSWREVMYTFAERVGPDELQAIAAQVYVEMLKAGYTRVCEFHYLHQQPGGAAYDDPASMSLALIEAAREAGIGLTLLPVLYMSGGFDGRALGERQRRFGLDVDAYLSLLERLQDLHDDTLQVGVALHSLRAVPAAAMQAVLESSLTRDCPIHIHIAEQVGEVQDCLAVRNTTPVAWLLDHASVDQRWCLVHATHMTDDERTRLAASGAVAGLCPTTEANLGDGLFPLSEYVKAGGALGIGSDSNISVSPVQELRWLEYGQRLKSGQRNVAAGIRDDDTTSTSVGETLWQLALRGGMQASAAVAPHADGLPGADFIVLDDAAAQLAARGKRSMLDSFIFAGDTPLVRDVMVAGRWQVQGFHHRDEQRIAERYRSVIEALQKA
ncbi:MAG: formimidoylglutamate deiminase [Xanthomonadales bacterium]|nr:formimidoylglutamate deiminase [Xanthomonadales bacterium]